MSELEERYLEALRELRRRTSTAEEMAKWKHDLNSRLWRATAVMRATGRNFDIKALESEVKAFAAVAARLTTESEERKKALEKLGEHGKLGAEANE